MKQQSHDVTQLLQAWRDGNTGARDQLVALVYDELRRLAHNYLVREAAGNSLQTTELVHEVYLRLACARQIDSQSRAHFYALAASLMRRILVDLARARKSAKRGGRCQKIALDEAAEGSASPDEALVSLDSALDALAEIEPRQARVVEMRFFGGLSQEETAEALAISCDTVLRDWNRAKLWLWHQMKVGG